MKRKLTVALLTLLVLTSLLPSGAEAFSGYWTYLNLSTDRSDLLDIAYGNGTWVTVGKNGSVVASADGASWTPRESGVETDLLSIAFGNGRFVAVGAKPVFSQNGTDWQTATVPAGSGTLTSVIFAAGKFTAATDKGQVYDSTDGNTWTLVKTFMPTGPFAPAPKLQSLTYNNGTYFLIDPSARRWEFGARQYQETMGWSSTCSRMLYLGGQYLILCTDFVVTGTPDARRWERRDPKTWVLLTDAVHDGRQYLAVGESGAMVSSPDGVNWTELAKPRQAPDYYALEYAAGLYVAAGEDGRIWTSRDGTAWTERYSGGAADLAAVAIARNLWVAVGGDGAIISRPFSGPGKTSRQSSGTQRSLRGVAANAEIFVAVGAGGTIITSEDSKLWRTQISGTDADLQAVIYAGGRFVAMGTSPAGKTVVVTSADGRSWKAQQLALSGFGALTYGESRFVAVGAGGLIATSPDGAAWTRVTSPVQTDLHSVAFGGGRFLAVGGSASAGTALTSADGTSWTKVEGAAPQPLYGVTYGAGRFFVVGGKGLAGYSADGLALQLVPEATVGELRAAAIHENTLVTVGQAGVVRSWLLASGSRSTVTVSAPRLKVGAQVSLTAVLMNDGGKPESYRKLTLKQSPDLVETTSSATTNSDGAARFEIKGVKAGTVTLTVVAEDGTTLGQPVTMSVEEPCGQRFADVPAKHPACKAIEQLAELKVINGFDDGFHPDRGLTRAELATMLVRALKLPVAPNEGLNFTDVQGHWAAKGGFLQAAVKAQAFGGMGDGTFQPDAQVTRAQLVKVVAAAANLTAAGAPPYSDVPATAWFAGWVQAARNARLIGPDAGHPVFTAGQFQSEQQATRAEAAAILANLLGNLPAPAVGK